MPTEHNKYAKGGWWMKLGMKDERFDGAACATGGHDPELWTADKDSVPPNTLRTLRTRAVTICMECPIIRKCGTYALRHPELTGVWGGMDDAQRSQIRRKYQITR